MKFIKLSKKHAVPIEQIQFIENARSGGDVSRVTVMHSDGVMAVYTSERTIDDLISEIHEEGE